MTKKDYLGILIILVTIPVFLVPILLWPEKITLDDETLCPPKGEIASVVVLIDKSDKWDHDDVSRIKELLESIFHEVPAQHRLSVYGIVGEKREFTKVTSFFSLCNPGSEEECDELFENCRQMKKRYDSAFIGPLKNIEETLMTPGQSSFSPLLGTVNEIVDETKSKSLTLHMISDFMENGSRFRFYDEVPLYDEMIEEYVLPDDVDLIVKGHFIQRRRHSSVLREAVQSVWKDYFEKQGAQIRFARIFLAD